MRVWIILFEWRSEFGRTRERKRGPIGPYSSVFGSPLQLLCSYFISYMLLLQENPQVFRFLVSSPFSHNSVLSTFTSGSLTNLYAQFLEFFPESSQSAKCMPLLTLLRNLRYDDNHGNLRTDLHHCSTFDVQFKCSRMIFLWLSNFEEKNPKLRELFHSALTPTRCVAWSKGFYPTNRFVVSKLSKPWQFDNRKNFKQTDFAHSVKEIRFPAVQRRIHESWARSNPNKNQPFRRFRRFRRSNWTKTKRLRKTLLRGFSRVFEVFRG